MPVSREPHHGKPKPVQSDATDLDDGRLLSLAHSRFPSTTSSVFTAFLYPRQRRNIYSCPIVDGIACMTVKCTAPYNQSAHTKAKKSPLVQYLSPGAVVSQPRCHALASQLINPPRLLFHPLRLLLRYSSWHLRYTRRSVQQLGSYETFPIGGRRVHVSPSSLP